MPVFKMSDDDVDAVIDVVLFLFITGALILAAVSAFHFFAG